MGKEPTTITNQELARLYVEIFGQCPSASSDTQRKAQTERAKAQANVIAAYAKPITPRVVQFYQSNPHYSETSIREIGAHYKKGTIPNLDGNIPISWINGIDELIDTFSELSDSKIYTDDLHILLRAVTLGKVDELRREVARNRSVEIHNPYVPADSEVRELIFDVRQKGHRDANSTWHCRTTPRVDLLDNPEVAYNR